VRNDERHALLKSVFSRQALRQDFKYEQGMKPLFKEASNSILAMVVA
jgi:hypothetical protein